MSANEALAAALAVVTAQSAETTDARDVEAKAQSAFDENGSDKRLDVLMRARLKRERLERLETVASEAVDAARADVKREEDATARARFDAARSRLTSWRSTILTEVEAIITLDRKLSTIVDRIADKLVDARDAFVEADALAEQLHIDDFRLSKPKMKEARLLVQVAIAQARAADRRDALEGWTDGAKSEIDWRDDDARSDFETALAALNGAQ